MSKTYSHSRKFWRRKFNKYKKEVRKRGEEPKINDISTFVGVYTNQKSLGEKGSITYQIARDEVYSLGYKSSLQFYSVVKRQYNDDISFKEFRKLSTEERMSRYGDVISDMYWGLIRAGNSKDDAGTFISQYWFGSK